ncbi:LLM class flavin-dependent oxidoreductase [Levilactobacillus brevis]
MRATTTPMNTCRWFTSCWRAVGKTARFCAIVSGASSAIRRKIHPINHKGEFFQVPGIHLSEPSPQRTPVLYQAGASSRGKQFAAEHAECVFVASPSKTLLKKTVADIRRRAAEAGRDPRSILIFNGDSASGERLESESAVAGWRYRPDAGDAAHRAAYGADVQYSRLRRPEPAVRSTD